jgi:hypothetical protein
LLVAGAVAAVLAVAGIIASGVLSGEDEPAADRQGPLSSADAPEFVVPSGWFSGDGGPDLGHVVAQNREDLTSRLPVGPRIRMKQLRTSGAVGSAAELLSGQLPRPPNTTSSEVNVSEIVPWISAPTVVSWRALTIERIEGQIYARIYSVGVSIEGAAVFYLAEAPQAIFETHIPTFDRFLETATPH